MCSVFRRAWSPAGFQKHEPAQTRLKQTKFVFLPGVYIKLRLTLLHFTGNITRIATAAYNVPNTNFTIPKGMRIFIPTLAGI